MKYLMRAPASPFENPSHLDAMKYDLVNTNSGNLLFPHSIARAVMLEDVEIDFTPMKKAMTPEEIEYANENYDAVIIPLANAFRDSFEKSLIFMADAIRQLKIPCIVVGVGYQGELTDDGNTTHSWDQAVKDFCSAVLEKSSCIGVRGDTTAAYLKSLGFREDKDFTVVGCPSLYLYGEDLPAPKPLNLTKDSRIHLSFKLTLEEKIYQYMTRVIHDIPDHYYIPQNHYELQTIYTGRTVRHTDKHFVSASELFPCDQRHPLYQENRVRGFVSAEAWLSFLKEGDLNFGTRIHGNIAGMLAGLPVFITAPDSRVLELARYHNIPHTTIPELDDSKDIFHLLDGVDFDSVLKGHKERFDYYVSFLNKNGLDTIFNHGIKENSPFDRIISEIDFEGPVIPFIHASQEEQLNAIEYWDWLLTNKEEQLAKAKDKNKRLKADLKEAKAKAKANVSFTRKCARKIKRTFK